MKKLSFACFFAAGLFLGNAWATDGIAVTAVCRWTGAGNIPENGLNMMQSDGVDMPGTIVKFAIQGDAVASADTLYNQSFAKFPVINLSGAKVAFYRWEARIQNGVLVDANKPRHISVMDIDGKNMRDLATFDPAKISFNDNRVYLDWTYGDWIYYTYPHRHWPDDNCIVWRVKANDSSTNQLVYTYNPPTWVNFARWDISANGKRSTFMGYWSWGYSCTGTEFPPAQAPDPRTGAYADMCCCNIACSPSGALLGRFVDGGHQNVNYSRWDATDIKKISSPVLTSLSTMTTWAGTNVGNGMAMLHWSTNSDKWYCVMPAGCRDAPCGANQVVTNQIDHKAIMTTHFPNFSAAPFSSTQVVTFATAGDFWVKGPAGSEAKIEDTLGQWISIDGSSEAQGKENNSHQLPSVARIFRSDAGIIFAAAAEGAYRIEIFSSNGTCVYSNRINGRFMNVPQEFVPQGIMLIRVLSELNGRTQIIRLGTR